MSEVLVNLIGGAVFAAIVVPVCIWLIKKFIQNLEDGQRDLKTYISREVTTIRNDQQESEKELMRQIADLEVRLNDLIQELPKEFLMRKEMERWMNSMENDVKYLRQSFERFLARQGKPAE